MVLGLVIALAFFLAHPHYTISLKGTVNLMAVQKKVELARSLSDLAKSTAKPPDLAGF